MKNLFWQENVVSTLINRRCFLRYSLLLTAGTVLTSCSHTEEVYTDESTYYVENKEKILDGFESVFTWVEKRCAERYDIDEASRLKQETMDTFSSMIPDLPYIGGSANDMTENLSMAAGILAYYRVMQAHGKSLDETGQTLYQGYDDMMSDEKLSGVIGWLSLSKLSQDKLRQEAELSRQRRFDGDWVFDFVPGDGNFDMGVDYLECGICKYFEQQDAAELAPYLCLLDFPASRAMNTGLVRTSTLAHGAACCDFRYTGGGQLKMEWTPDFLKQSI